MRFFINTKARASESQALMIHHGASVYHLTLMHLTLDEARDRGTRRRHHPEHSHPLYHWVLYTLGEDACTVGGLAIPYRPGTLVMTSPGELHDFSARGGAKTLYSEITFSLLDADEKPLLLPTHEVLGLWAGCPMNPQTAVSLSEGQVTRFLALMEEIFTRQNAPSPRFPFERLEPVAALFSHLVRILAGEHVAGDRASAVHRAREYLEAHLTEKVSIEALAAHTGMSGEALIRKFRAAFGLPPVAWQLRRRMEDAAVLLASTDLRVSDIAERLGFCDVQHFSHLFRKIRGQAPTQLRRG